MQQNNAFTVAKRTLEGQDMVYQSIKFTNNVWALAELKIQPGNPNITVNRKIYYDSESHNSFYLAEPLLITITFSSHFSWQLNLEQWTSLKESTKFMMQFCTLNYTNDHDELNNYCL